MHLLFSFLLFFSPPFLTENGTIEWLVPTEHEFGDLKQGEPATFDFRFRNNGEEAIVIDNVRTTCGCTTPDWSDTVVPPGGESAISIEYSAKKEGYFYKKISVYFSGQRKAEKLYISGYVE